ncbi:hypothetical protein Tco_0541067 [Tanacetum coccineum]
MDPHTSLECLCMDEHHKITLNDMIESEGDWSGPEYLDTMDNAYNGVANFEYEKNMISNEFVVKLGLNYKVKKNGEKVVTRELLVALRAVFDFGNGILTIWPKMITFDSDDDDLDVLLASINVEDLPPLDIFDFPPLVCKMGKNLRNKNKPSKTYKMSYNGEGPSLTINSPKTQEKLTREEMKEDLYERVMLLNERRPIIKTLKYSDKYKKLLDGVLLDKLKLDGEFELEDEMTGEELIRVYNAIKEKGDP